MECETRGSLLQGLKERLEARRLWEEENPELARLWTEAMREDHERATRREVEQARVGAAERASDRLRRIGVPVDAVEALRALRDEPAVVAARRFLAQPAADARFLVLLGKKGTGKTVAGALVLREMLTPRLAVEGAGGDEARRAEAVCFILASTLARMSGYASDDKAWFEDLCAARGLLIDDYGAEHMTQFGAGMLDELLTRRHGARLRTVITSNLSKDLFEQRVGERLFDRIRTSCVFAATTGDSLRRRSS